MLSPLKRLLPDRPVPVRIIRGPFRGASVLMNPRHSMRKVFGLYEHELNGWLETALSRVSRVIDVGANDGYFTFGCAAAFARRGIRGEIIGIEPQERHADDLRRALATTQGDVRIRVVQALVGDQDTPDMLRLDAIDVSERTRTLIKIDVEGAEIDVIAGAAAWMTGSNLFVIEVHRPEYERQLLRTFAQRGLTLTRVGQRPLPLLGRELRDKDTSWLVSAVSHLTSGAAA